MMTRPRIAPCILILICLEGMTIKDDLNACVNE